MTEPTERQKAEERFWSESARTDCLPAIYSSEQVLDPATREDAFDAAGTRDARRLAGFVAPHMRVVDLGCGIGRVMRPLASRCREIVGVDVSAEMIERSHEYLAGVPNASVVPTDGATLQGIEEDSVGFLYSLLCLIHVNKRSAFRYFREIRRVLVPGGMAYLEFQDILSDEGFGTFERVLETDYPLEFYTLEEVEEQMRRVGLEVLHARAETEFLHVVVLRGSAARWIQETSEGVRISDLRQEGLFGEEEPGPGTPGSLSCCVSSGLDQARTLRAVLTLTQGQDCFLHVEAPVLLEPGASQELLLKCSGDLESASISWGNEAAGFATQQRSGRFTPGKVEMHVGLLPSGFDWSRSTQERFPNLCLSRALEMH